jgi:choline kinase
MDDGISVVILATLPDNGIKSLGSKSLLPFRGKYLIEHQLEAIRHGLKNKKYDITIMSGFDNQRMIKSLSSIAKKYDIKIIKQDYTTNLNFGGSLIESIGYSRYPNILSINYGVLFKPSIISSIVQTKETNKVTVSNNHSYNSNIKVGCYDENNKIVNLFYNLGNKKYMDINYWTAPTVKFIQNNISFQDYHNRFIFELVNLLINHNYIFESLSVDPKHCLLVDSIKTFTKSKRIFADEITKHKKTKY